jgi:hypothetical protein
MSGFPFASSECYVLESDNTMLEPNVDVLRRTDRLKRFFSRSKILYACAQKFSFIFLVFPMSFFFPLKVALADSQVHLCQIGGETTWYFAIGRDVFRQPSSDLVKFLPDIDDVNHSDALIPPNPASPVGCKDNPQQIQDFHAVNWPQIEGNDYTGPIPKFIYVFQMFRNFDYHPEQNPPSSHYSSIRKPGDVCKGDTYSEQFSDGITYCTNKKIGLNSMAAPFTADLGWEFIIPPNVYPLPLGQELIVGGASLIDVQYLLTPDINLWYIWYVPKQMRRVDPQYAMTIDELMQKSILSQKIQNYPWPPQP